MMRAYTDIVLSEEWLCQPCDVKGLSIPPDTPTCWQCDSTDVVVIVSILLRKYDNGMSWTHPKFHPDVKYVGKEAII